MAISLKQLFPQFDPETEQVSDADFRNQSKINYLFQLLNDEKAILKIKLQGSKTLFNSCIIDVDTRNSLFTLDELHPAQGHKLMVSTGNFIAHAIIKGVSISFHTSLIKLGRNGQFNCYSCDIPNSISYVQRRKEYRVNVHEPHSIQVTAQHQSSLQLMQGKVHDISMQGIGVDFKTQETIKPGEELTNCRLVLPKHEPIDFALDVRHVQSTTQGSVRIGAQYRGLDTRSEETICRLVRELERTSLRK